MITLNLKVLLIELKTNVIATLKPSFRIWICTSLLASLFHWINQTTGMGIEKIFLLSLILSAPAAVMLVPILYFMNLLPHNLSRVTYGFASVLVICAIEVVLFLRIIKGFPIDRQTIIIVLTPYILAAEVSFFLFSRKFFSPVTTINN